MTTALWEADYREYRKLEQRLRSKPWWQRGWVIWTIAASSWITFVIYQWVKAQ